MTFADLINNLLQSSRERIKNPFIGSIICSFLIYNWKPIVFVLFSEQPIEDRLLVIKYEYCYPLAFLLPILFAVIYTIYFPMLMVMIDKNLEETKKHRITNIYVAKDHTLDEKITLAKKEFQLKNIESGNKEREEFEIEIQQLKDQLKAAKENISELNNSNKVYVDGLSNQLNSVIERHTSTFNELKAKYDNLFLEKQQLEVQKEDYEKLSKYFVQLDTVDYITLNKVFTFFTTPETIKEYSKLENLSSIKLKELKLISLENNEYKLTPLGNTILAKVGKIIPLF